MNKTLNRASNLLLLFLGTFSQAAILADSFNCLTERSLWLWLAALCLLLWCAGAFRKSFWICIPLCFALLYFAYRYYGGDPVLQFGDLIDRISGAFYTHITHPGESYPYANAVPSHSLILLLIGFLLAAYLSSALNSGSLRIPLSLLETLPIFSACVMVDGTVPAFPALALVLFWALLLVGGSGFRANSSQGRSVLCCLLPVALLLGGLLMLHDPAAYQYTDRDMELSQRFDKLTNYFELFRGRGSQENIYSADPEQAVTTNAPRSSFQSSWDSDDSSMQLRNPYDPSHLDLRLMQIKAETTGRIYLRTLSYGDYCGNGWLPAEELSSGSSLPFTAFAAEASPYGVKRELEVRTFLDLKALCIPYYAAVSTGSDACVTAEDQINYRIGYTDYSGSFSQLSLPESARAGETMYRSHAHSVYTRLPDSTREQALQICRDAGLRADDPDLIQKLAAYVRESGQYDLNTAAYPSDDYAIYFLTVSHRGYCIHYATAAAVLYRALGVPARVTGGFVAETKAGSFTDVVAGNAHAWVEVYQDGVGWLPIEVTSEQGLVPPEPSPEIGQEESPSPEPEQKSGPEPSPEAGGDSGAGQEDPPPRETSFPWKLLLILPGFALLLLIWYWLARARFLTQIRNPDGRRGVLACWRYAKRVSSFGAEIPEDIVNLAEKVTFSLHTIKREELELCRTELLALIGQVYPSLSSLRRFCFRFLLGLK